MAADRADLMSELDIAMSGQGETEHEDDKDRFFNYRLFKSIRFIEDTIVIIGGALHLLILRLNPPANLLINRWTLTFVFLCIYFAISRIDLIDSSRQTKLICLIIMMLCVTAAHITGFSQLTAPLFALIMARVVLLLEGRLIIWLSSGVFLLFMATAVKMVWLEPHWKGTLLQPGVALVFLTSLFYHPVWQYSAIMALVAYLVHSLSHGRKQLIQAEKLSHRVAAMARELERNRIARDMHDGIGHSLTSLSVQLEVAKKLFKRDPLKAQESLDQAEKMAKACLKDMRSAVALLRDSDFSLSERISSLAKDVMSSGALSVETELDIPELPPLLAHQTYRIVQECTTNAIKHSGASLLKISLTNSDDQLRILIEDDGKGFDATKVSNGFGIAGIKERVDEIGGSVQFISKEGSGTSVSVRVPLGSRNNAISGDVSD